MPRIVGGTLGLLLLIISIAAIVTAAIIIGSNLQQRQQVVVAELEVTISPASPWSELVLPNATQVSFQFRVDVNNPNAGSILGVRVNITLTSACPAGAVVGLAQIGPLGPPGLDMCTTPSLLSTPIDLTGGQAAGWIFDILYDTAGTYDWDITASGTTP